MATFISSSLQPATAPKLNIGLTPIMDKEITVHFNDDNHLVVKEKLVDMRNIALLPYP